MLNYAIKNVAYISIVEQGCIQISKEIERNSYSFPSRYWHMCQTQKKKNLAIPAYDRDNEGANRNHVEKIDSIGSWRVSQAIIVKSYSAGHSA